MSGGWRERIELKLSWAVYKYIWKKYKKKQKAVYMYVIIGFSYMHVYEKTSWNNNRFLFWFLKMFYNKVVKMNQTDNRKISK